jgi:hypothetical protein
MVQIVQLFDPMGNVPASAVNASYVKRAGGYVTLREKIQEGLNIL